MYKRLEKILKARGITPYRIYKETRVAQSTLSDWKTGKSMPKADKIKKIADFLEVSDNLFSENSIVTCSFCGLSYVPDCNEDFDKHELFHEKWKEAVKKFGFCWTYAYREKMKADGRNNVNKKNLSIEERVEHQINILKALFSRSLVASECDLNHPNFEDYIAMMLKNEAFKQTIPDDIFKILFDKHGEKEGISKGTYFREGNFKDNAITPPQSKAPFAAYNKKDDEFSKEEIEKINSFIDFVKSQRGN